MAVMIHPFGPKPHPLAEIIPINCTGCGICAMWCLMPCIDQPPKIGQMTQVCRGIGLNTVSINY